jgi:hypothetical protein
MRIERVVNGEETVYYVSQLTYEDLTTLADYITLVADQAPFKLVMGGQVHHFTGTADALNFMVGFFNGWLAALPATAPLFTAPIESPSGAEVIAEPVKRA